MKPTSEKTRAVKYLNHAKLDGLRIFSLSVLLISAHYLHVASMAEMRRESREALPRDGFHALRDSHFNGMI
jgi:hypothetical protein